MTKEKQLTIALLTEKIEKLTGKKVIFEATYKPKDVIKKWIVMFTGGYNRADHFTVKGEKISIIAMDGGPSAVMNISELERQIPTLTPQELAFILSGGRKNTEVEDAVAAKYELAHISDLDDYM